MLLRKVYKSIVFSMLDILGYDNKYSNFIISNDKLVILNLHRITDEINPFYPSLSLRLFEELLVFISKRFNVTTFIRSEGFIKNNKPNVILSFDDGFYDFLENAVPLLNKYKIKANLNVIPDCIQSGNPVWDVMLGDILNQAPIDRINNIDLPNFNTKLNQSNKSSYGLALTRYLKKMEMKERNELWPVFEKLAEESGVKYTKMLSKNEILEILKTHEIGVHSYTHESMGQESQSFFEKDFNKCQDYFRNELKIPMNIYAFPSGSYKQYQIEYLLANGIENVLLVNEGYSNKNTKIHNRFTYYADSKSEVKLRALGFHR